MSRKDVNEKIDNYRKVVERARKLPGPFAKLGMEPGFIEGIAKVLAEAERKVGLAEVRRKECKDLEAEAAKAVAEVAEAVRFLRRMGRLDAAKPAPAAKALGAKLAPKKRPAAKASAPKQAAEPPSDPAKGRPPKGD